VVHCNAGDGGCLPEHQTVARRRRWQAAQHP
jgi:hypothetical protein